MAHAMSAWHVALVSARSVMAAPQDVVDAAMIAHLPMSVHCRLCPTSNLATNAASHAAHVSCASKTGKHRLLKTKNSGGESRH